MDITTTEEATVAPHAKFKRGICKADKLRFKSEFDYVRLAGKKQVGKAFLVVVASAPESEGLKCGVICGRKFNTRAVVRNRARRLLWESFRLLKPEIVACRIILIPRRRILTMKRQEVTIELATLLIGAGVLDKSCANSLPEC